MKKLIRKQITKSNGDFCIRYEILDEDGCPIWQGRIEPELFGYLNLMSKKKKKQFIKMIEDSMNIFELLDAVIPFDEVMDCEFLEMDGRK